MYNFDTKDIKLEEKGLPVGTHKLIAIKENFITKDDKPDNPNALVITWEVAEGESKGRQGDVYYNVNHVSPQTAAIARQTIKQIAIVTGSEINNQNPIKGRVLTAIIRPQAKNPQYTEIAKYLPENNIVTSNDVPM